jgi:hypothetical protein
VSQFEGAATARLSSPKSVREWFCGRVHSLTLAALFKLAHYRLSDL